MPTLYDGPSTFEEIKQALYDLYHKHPHCIQNKREFKLNVHISQEHIRLNLWPEIFNTFKVPVEAYENEGADVKVTFAYYHDPGHQDSDVEYDLMDAIQHSETYDWKATAIAYFNTCPSMENRHRLYLHENSPGFDHRNSEWYTEDELEDHYQREAYYDDDYDEDMYHDPVAEENKKNFVYPGLGHCPLFEYTETGTLKHTPGICKCTDCAWLWTHLERAIDVSIADGKTLDVQKVLVEIVVELHKKGVDVETLDSGVLVEGTGREMRSILGRKKFELENQKRAEATRELDESEHGWDELYQNGFWVSPSGQRITLGDEAVEWA